MVNNKSNMKEITENRKTASITKLPPGYDALLEEIKNSIRTAQVKAALSVNRSLISLYWDIGKAIVEQQQKEGWGKSVVEKLASDIQHAFPSISGFSPRNIWRMRAFYLAWTSDVKKLPQAVAELNGKNLPQVVAQIPWGHNALIIEKLQDPLDRLWYVQMTVKNGWSRAVLAHQIESRLVERQGSAVTNFEMTLPAPQSDLATQLLKDPYNFDFLTLAEGAHEKELEHALMEQMRHFLLEMGSGFAFVGQQLHLEVDNEDFYIDLLFYHLQLRCYIVIDLKVVEFKPEFAGKMNFYLSAVDEKYRHPEDRPSMGLIICKTRSKTIAEYSLRDLTKPMGVARYITGSLDSIPDDYRKILPSQEQLEEKLRKLDVLEVAD